MTATKGRRYPFRRRVDGEMKLMHVQRMSEALGVEQALRRAGYEITDYPGLPPSANAAERTRSPRYRAGSRRTKRLAGAR